MSTKKMILMTISVLLTIEVLFVFMLALFFPSTERGFVRSENFDQTTLDNVETAQLPSDLTNFENLIKLQETLDKTEYFSMTKDSKVTAEQSKNSYTKQSVYDKKEKRDNTINYQSIQIKEKGYGIADTFAPGNAGTKVSFDLTNKSSTVTKATRVTGKEEENCEWGDILNTFATVDDYTMVYGNWGNYMTDYFFAEKNDIQNADKKEITYDAQTQLYTLTVQANESAAEHYKKKIITLGNGSVNQVNFNDNCATITFQFDKNWKLYSYAIKESYQTVTKLGFLSIKTTTTATHNANFYYA